MKKVNDKIDLSASDLSNHIACRHVTFLNLCQANGMIEPPKYRDPNLKILQERGLEFEQSYLQSLKDKGFSISEPRSDDAVTGQNRTIEAMQEGVDFIYQASLKSGIWHGKADFLKRVERPGKLGCWSYEVIDTKLAKSTRAGTILQICLYSQLVAEIQGVMPEFMYVMTPENETSVHTYRVDDFIAFFRSVQRDLKGAIGKVSDEPYTYPNPVEHCDICRWWQKCDRHRRDDDHLSLVAGIAGVQIEQVKKWGVETVQKLAELPVPLTQRPSRGSPDTYVRVREQARVQVEARIKGTPVHELLDINEGRGFCRLPQPSEGDIFFDFEGDPFVGTNGLEYLFGWLVIDGDNENYHSIAALTQAAEKKAFEDFVDMVIARWEIYPDLHIYHFTSYEPATLKRLMGKYATRENEIDRMLRGELFIDVHSITKQSIRAGVEKYSLKDLEIFHGFERELPLKEASINLRAIERFLEIGTASNITNEMMDGVKQYNKEDCISTKRLRDWLEKLRNDLILSGKQITRPVAKSPDASESLTDHEQRIQPIYQKLTDDVSPDRSERSIEEQGRWLLANMLNWYRRENKATWWEYFRLRELSDEEFLEEKAALAGLRFTGQREKVKRSFIDTYTYPPQECEIRKGDCLKCGNGDDFGEAMLIDYKACTINIKKGPAKKDIHPTAVFKHNDVKDSIKEEAIIRMAEWVAENGIDAAGRYRAGRDLLLEYSPRIISPVSLNGNPQQTAVAWVQLLDRSILPIQGPPGTGKSHTAAQMIISLVRSGKKVGITALSHKVIRGLLEKVIKASEEQDVPLRCIQKVTELSGQNNAGIVESEKSDAVLKALQSNEVQVAAGTAWLWARQEFEEVVDVLFVDEAGQFSLVDALAVSHAAKNIVLLGDPQQLKQPQQGSHPEGTDVSALEHILRDHKTIPPGRGIFLNETWRMHPTICSFVSELFYEGRLHPIPELINQVTGGSTRFTGAGLRFVGVHHENNQSSSAEEAEAVAGIITELTKGDVYGITKKGEKQLISLSDIMVIAPYNAHVAKLAEKLPAGAHIGTVDKFQGQEAPIVIYSMSTSSPEDAPRGMEFLYSLNRLNVAVSRAKSIFILVANPKLFQPNCRNPEQMRLANAFCRYLELSETS